MVIMSLEDQLSLCSEHYQKWKQIALTSEGLTAKKATEHAFFWLELQSAFIILHAIEKTRTDPQAKKKILLAKTNLSKRLADYAQDILDEIIGG